LQDKTETAIVLITAAVAGFVAALNGLLPIYVLYVGQAAFLLMWGYTIFWAFSLRRLLSAHLYRNQALGVGLVAIGWAMFNYSFLSSNNVIPNVALPIAALLTFYWIDASVLAGRKSDPLYRNTLHWRELRLALWSVLVGAITTVFFGILFNPSVFIIINYSGIGANPSPLVLFLLFVVFFAVFVPGTVYLLATAFRSRDLTLRKHLLWFGSFSLFFFVFSLAGVTTGQSTLFGLAYVIGTYCLYRSAKSLAPLNRLPVKV
jgi:hypothetical protein